ncbi:MAG: DUF2851 family protein [Bacteroidota bacterium]|nr:DUF2851 family protein [Bacteroidota bacterium]
MNEDFLHYVWKFGLFDKTGLKTTSGEPLSITKPGEHNYDSGPDFFNSKIQLNDTLWFGNVEIHINSSDWNKHLHQNDKAYNNVVLHVVLNHDKEIKNEIGEILPVLELKFRILPNVQRNYELLESSKKAIACTNMLDGVKEHTSSAWLQRMAIERLEEKMEAIKSIFINNNKDWQETFYQLLARNFGFQINGDAFYLLAKHLPLQIIYKHRSSLFQLESLLFGQSGLLEDQLEEPYAQKLQNEYEFLRKKYSLIPLKKENWKYLRMRPVNFPTIRIAQFAALLHTSSHLFSKIVESNSITETKRLFTAEPSEFWNTHYSFTSLSKSSTKAIGDSTASNILINTVAPLLFFYGKEKEDDRYTERTVELLFSIEPEDNKITREYSDSGLMPKNAGESQGMINLHKNYCKKFACLNCTIGNSILRQESYTIVDN